MGSSGHCSRSGRVSRLPFDLRDLRKGGPPSFRSRRQTAVRRCLINDASFDIVSSFDSFEHMPDPEAALDQIVRVTRQGGLIFLDFGPLYASAWGLHAYRSLRMPFPQFLFSPEFINLRLEELGIPDWARRAPVPVR